MISLQSSLEHVETRLSEAKKYLHNYGFTIGGNWDYQHGCFDHSLDGVNKVWLRIPFQVTQGVLDREEDDSKAEISLGTPFVLKHVYNEGMDPEAAYMTYGGLLDQFQDPLDKDADIEPKWIEKASVLLKQIEEDVQSITI
jgi:hypothetical protein